MKLRLWLAKSPSGLTTDVAIKFGVRSEEKFDG